MAVFSKILVANRGEIAIRVFRTLRELGIGTVAVYSEADRGSLHVAAADEAYLIGPGPAAESYLNQERLLETAARSGAEAVHPGYGFLAENAEFARACQAAGLVWIGPPPEAIDVMGSKTAARETMRAAGVPIVPGTTASVESAEDVRRLGDELGWPIVAKASRGGYDGKGVWRLDSAADAAQPFARPSDGVQIIGEEFVDFTRELSALVVRSPSGQAAAYPISESVQRHGICVETITPAPGLGDEQAIAAEELALMIAHELGVVGMLAVELMQRADGSIVVNELAMRPHNTGHWTIDGARTSQFENHLRAVLDLPLGDPSSKESWTVMANVFGGKNDDLPSALLHCFARDRRLRVQLYGKQVRPGRKVGHVTASGDDLEQTRKRARHAAAYLMGDPNA